MSNLHYALNHTNKTYFEFGRAMCFCGETPPNETSIREMITTWFGLILSEDSRVLCENIIQNIIDFKPEECIDEGGPSEVPDDYVLVGSVYTSSTKDFGKTHGELYGD